VNNPLNVDYPIIWVRGVGEIFVSKECGVRKKGTCLKKCGQSIKCELSNYLCGVGGRGGFIFSLFVIF